MLYADNVLMLGVVGSKAYGLDTPQSDVDRLGVFMAPTRVMLGLTASQVSETTYHTTSPDLTLHEVGKFCRLALQCNPSILELLWLPRYETLTMAGSRLLQIRESFLYTEGVKGAYGGYANDQLRKLINRHDAGKAGFSSDVSGRTAKHGRHVARLLIQGEHLLRTGRLTIDFSGVRDDIMRYGELAVSDPDAYVMKMNALKERFSYAVASSVLPRSPARGIVEETLRSMRSDAM